jgi:biopolymer transport protein ExbD
MSQGRTIRSGSTGLRTRFFPRSRIAPGLIGIAPWVNVVLLLLFFHIVGSRLMLQPGIVVSLPQAPFTDGTRPGLMVVVLPVGGAQAGAGEEMVFFDDERFRVNEPAQMDRLKQAFGRAARLRPDTALILQADQQVRHGTVVTLMNMALEVGISRVNVAEKPRQQ